MADDPMIVHDVETCYTAYAEAFNHQDMAAVVRYIAAPYAMVIGANPPMFAPTPEAVRKQFDGALAGMKARGWVRSDFKIVHTWLLSKDHALLMSDIVRYKADKSVLEKGRSTAPPRHGRSPASPMSIPISRDRGIIRGPEIVPRPISSISRRGP